MTDSHPDSPPDSQPEPSPEPSTVPPTGPTPIAQTERTTIRNAKRARTAREDAYAILDDDFIAHVGFAIDGQPFVIPMVYGRHGDAIYLHGSVATRIMRALDAGAPACITVTKVDGLVIARSQFHHSVNYRCVVGVGTATQLRGDKARWAFDIICDHLLDGRAEEARDANRVEERQTMVLEFPLDEISVKVREGGPVDDPSDLPAEGELSDAWAGILPLRVVAGVPIPDVYTSPEAALPAAIAAESTRWN